MTMTITDRLYHIPSQKWWQHKHGQYRSTPFNPADPKGHVHVSHYLASSILLLVFILFNNNISHFDLLWNYVANWNIAEMIFRKSSTTMPYFVQVSLKTWSPEEIHVSDFRYQKIFCSEITWPIRTKLCRNGVYAVLYTKTSFCSYQSYNTAARGN
jgi:hypothetical protein